MQYSLRRLSPFALGTFAALFVAGAVFAGVHSAHAAQLSSTQRESVLDLLRSFNVDAQTIENVRSALDGGGQTAGESASAGIGSTQTKTNGAAVASAGSVCPHTWTQNRSKGDRGPDVRALQRFLNETLDQPIADSGPGSPGNETDFYGPATKQGVGRFQQRHRQEVLAPAGVRAANGFFGFHTRKKATELCGGDVSRVQRNTASASENAAPASGNIAARRGNTQTDPSSGSSYLDALRQSSRQASSGLVNNAGDAVDTSIRQERSYKQNNESLIQMRPQIEELEGMLAACSTTRAAELRAQKPSIPGDATLRQNIQDSERAISRLTQLKQQIRQASSPQELQRLLGQRTAVGAHSTQARAQMASVEGQARGYREALQQAVGECTGSPVAISNLPGGSSTGSTPGGTAPQQPEQPFLMYAPAQHNNDYNNACSREADLLCDYHGFSRVDSCEPTTQATEAFSAVRGTQRGTVDNNDNQLLDVTCSGTYGGTRRGLYARSPGVLGAGEQQLENTAERSDITSVFNGDGKVSLAELREALQPIDWQVREEMAYVGGDQSADRPMDWTLRTSNWFVPIVDTQTANAYKFRTGAGEVMRNRLGTEDHGIPFERLSKPLVLYISDTLGQMPDNPSCVWAGNHIAGGLSYTVGMSAVHSSVNGDYVGCTLDQDTTYYLHTRAFTTTPGEKCGATFEGGQRIPAGTKCQFVIQTDGPTYSPAQHVIDLFERETGTTDTTNTEDSTSAPRKIYTGCNNGDLCWNNEGPSVFFSPKPPEDPVSGFAPARDYLWGYECSTAGRVGRDQHDDRWVCRQYDR